MSRADRSRIEPCGCHSDAPTGLVTSFCALHGPTRGLKSDGKSDLPAPYYEDGAVTIYHGDCRDFVITADVIITDPPYGITDHAWDIVVPAEDWMKARGCVAFAAEPYATHLIDSAPLPFRYDLVWAKNTAGNRFNAHRRPLSTHERLLVFGDPTFTPIMVPRSPDEMLRLNQDQRRMYPDKFPGSVLSFEAVNNRNGERTDHPSQKPVDLMSWLVRSYSIAGEVLLDPFCGSGSTLLAAKQAARRAIGIELDQRLCEIAAKRCSQEVLDLAV